MFQKAKASPKTPHAERSNGIPRNRDVTYLQAMCFHLIPPQHVRHRSPASPMAAGSAAPRHHQPPLCEQITSLCCHACTARVRRGHAAAVMHQTCSSRQCLTPPAATCWPQSTFLSACLPVVCVLQSSTCTPRPPSGSDIPVSPPPSLPDSRDPQVLIQVQPVNISGVATSALVAPSRQWQHQGLRGTAQASEDAEDCEGKHSPSMVALAGFTGWTDC
jgi:hypothetical protein